MLLRTARAAPHAYAVRMASAASPLPETAGFDAPAVLGIEASGFGRDSYPVEIGFVLPDGQSYCSLIRPAPGWTHWDPAAERVHRIPLATVVKHGREVLEVATQLNERLRGRTLYCDGWAHDCARLGALYEAAGLNPTFRLDNLRALLTDQEAAFWNVVKTQVTTEMRLPRHRASSDAKVLQQTLVRLRGPLPRRPVPAAAG